MRIRNSRPSIPILLLPHQMVPRSSPFHSQDPLINGRFLAQEGSQTLLGSGSGSRTSNCSRTVPRVEREDRSNFPSVVLALPARSSRPERELPVKKRMFYRLDIGKKKTEEKSAVMEIDMNVTPIAEKEDSFEINKSCRKIRSVRCSLNRESFIPCLIMNSLKDREKAEDSLAGAPLVKYEGTEKRRRGRPKKKPRATRGNYGFKKSIYVLD